MYLDPDSDSADGVDGAGGDAGNEYSAIGGATSAAGSGATDEVSPALRELRLHAAEHAGKTYSATSSKAHFLFRDRDWVAALASGLARCGEGAFVKDGERVAYALYRSRDLLAAILRTRFVGSEGRKALGAALIAKRERKARRDAKAGRAAVGSERSAAAAAAPSRKRRRAKEKQAPAPAAAPIDALGAELRAMGPGTGAPPWKVLSLNIWFNEEACVAERISGFVALVRAEHPDALALQEVTRRIEAELRRRLAPLGWSFERQEDEGQRYWTLLAVRAPCRFRHISTTATSGVKDPPRASTTIPLNTSQQGRALHFAVLEDSGAGRGARPAPRPSIMLATLHAESPTGWATLNVAERQRQVQQCQQILAVPASKMNVPVVFAADFNWHDARDGPIASSTASVWIDAWRTLATLADVDAPGCTYDMRRNAMLRATEPFAPRSVPKRMDRVLIHEHRARDAGADLGDYCRVAIVGVVPLRGPMRALARPPPGRASNSEADYEGSPLCISDHFGLLTTCVYI